MKALITGASSGLGADFAKLLHKKGFELILTARRYDRLESLKSELGDNVSLISCDLSKKEGAYELYEKVKNEKIDLIINNAGFGAFGAFFETDIERELEMIELNISSLHILTKLFLKDFKKEGKGYILNVASVAGLMPGGPLMATYYATKAYVVSLTNGIYAELKRDGVPIRICALCPGPFDTEFNSVAGVKFSVLPMKSEEVAKYALKKLFKGKKNVIIPGMTIKLTNFIRRFMPTKLLLLCTYKIQKKKKQ